MSALRADTSPRARRIQAAAADGHNLVSGFAKRHSTALWIVAGVVLTLVLRAPWFDAPLGRDEGGDLLVAQWWTHSGPYAYGPVFWTVRRFFWRSTSWRATPRGYACWAPWQRRCWS